MKPLLATFTYILAILCVAISANAIDYEAEADKGPDVIFDRIETSDYAGKLAIAREAYRQSQTKRKPLLKNICVLALARTPRADQFRFAVEFFLAQKDFDLQMFGLQTVSNSLKQGEAVDPELCRQALAALKVSLPRMAASPKFSENEAMDFRNALMLLHDDMGLDIELSSSDGLRHDGLVDNYEEDSPPSVFAELSRKYQQAVKPDRYSDNDRVSAAKFELCRLRRTQNILIRPLHPPINLDSFRYKPPTQPDKGGR